MRITQIVCVLFLAWCAQAQEDSPAATPHYIETGECPGEQLCSYSYSAQQQYYDDEEGHRTKVNATVDIMCTSSGLYNGSDAKLYCMNIKNANLISSSLADSSDTEINEIKHSLNSLLENWFCFVQSSTGKVPAVFHSPSEPDHAISLKKAIAAAFQANFEGTEEEEETDPQSRHKSHYTYDPTAENGVQKMYRRVRAKDISEYSTEEASDKIDTSKDEEIQYRNGRLEKSSGNTSFHLVNDSDSNGANDSTLSQLFSASGSYSIDLQSCRRLNKYALGLQKKKIFSEMQSNSKQEGLKATIDKRAEATHQMKTLRSKLPAGSALRALQDHEAFGDKILLTLNTLMKLESQYGALPMYVPVIDDIMTFIANIPDMVSDSEKRVRSAVLMLLASEGSLKSQMALLNAYDNAVDSTEANTILTHITFIENVRTGFVIAMEERLSRPVDDRFVAGQLLLVFASLATKGSDEVEDRVMNYLSARITELSAVQLQTDVDDIILILRALGNTGSKLSIGHIFNILDSSIDHVDYYEIKLAVIDSLVKVTDDPIVLEKLESVLEEDSTTKLASTIINTLIDALDYVKERQDFSQYISYIKSHTLLYSLVETVASSNDTDLHLKIEYYFKKIEADPDLYDLLYIESGPLGHRGKRGTDWDQNIGDYNLVSSLSDRQSDVSTYSNHQAYINSHSLGVDNARVKLAYGFFAGAGIHCDRVKAFGRARVELSLLNGAYRDTLADAKVEVRATTTSAYVDAYARVSGTTYFTYHLDESLDDPCRLYTRNIAEFRRSRSWSYNVYVYIGYLSLTVNIEVFLTLDVNANMCIGRTGTEVTGALGALTPRAGITLGGGVSGNLLELARGGVDLSATFTYQLEPAVSVQGCTAYCSLSARVCVGIYDSFPDNYIDLETWYQTRTWDWCGSGWLSYPCLVWGSRNRWDALSSRWNLGGRGRAPLYQYCYGNLHPTCAAGALSSPLFSY